MTTAAEVGKKAQQLGKQLKAVIEVGEFLSELGDLEQAISEAKKASVVASDQRLEALEDLLTAQAGLETVQQWAETLNKDIKRAETETNKMSADIISQAQSAAAIIREEATSEAKACADDMAATMAGLEKQRATLVSQIVQLDAEYVELKQGFRVLREKTRSDD